MPFERVAFPRVTREAQTNPVAEMDAMWMVGFLDHEEKHGPSGSSAQTMKDYEVRQPVEIFVAGTLTG